MPMLNSTFNLRRLSKNKFDGRSTFDGTKNSKTVSKIPHQDINRLVTTPK